MLLAASTQRTVGLVILAIVFLGGLVFIYFNIRSAREEVGSEIELASNRKPYLSDEELEGREARPRPGVQPGAAHHRGGHLAAVLAR